MRTLTFLLILGCLFSLKMNAQISEGGTPPGFYKFSTNDLPRLVSLQAPQLPDLRSVDKNQPYQVGVSVYTDIGPLTSGSWTDFSDGSMIWRCAIKIKDAKALALYFDRFEIPEGAGFWVYSPDRKNLLGSFSKKSNSGEKGFAISYIPGDIIIAEYYLPAHLAGYQDAFHIDEISYAFREVLTGRSGFGSSGPCEVNVNCSEGTYWQQQKKGVARILITRGGIQVYCTGSLVNNAKEDRTPYFLTAGHCGKNASHADLDKWIFYFDYEAPGCENPSSEPAYKSITGGTTLANTFVSNYNIGSDLYLLRFNDNIPTGWDVYFNGWTTSESPSQRGVGIHHPEGDIKKISTYTQPLSPASYKATDESTHWEVKWSATTNGHGVTEAGSSGSPIFNSDGLIVGTLTGGLAGCDSNYLNSPDYYGRFDYSWNKNGSQDTAQLKAWLDPDNSGITKLSGITLGVEEKNILRELTIKPNPAQDFIEINFPASFANDQSTFYEISDIGGRILKHGKIQSASVQKIDISFLGAGSYIIRISGENEAVSAVIFKQ